jgi:amidophosphoribosyltransferase
MCGIIGIVSSSPINHALVNSLKSLQHRGQQSAGMATMDGNLMHLKKDLGLVKDVITEYDMTYLRGNAGIGHVRYPTAGSANDPEQAHPFYVNSPFGIMLAHNGNLTNAQQLRDDVLTKNHRHVRTHSDSEILTNVFAFELEQLTVHKSLSNDKIFEAITSLNNRIKGGYAVVSLIANYGLVAFRDPNGIRPLVMGRRTIDKQVTHLVSSETCAIDINGFELIRTIKPGEAVIIKLDGTMESRICHPNPQLNICLFEFVYLSRPDSVIEDVPVQLARRNMGKYLADTIREHNIDVDVVIPVPDTSRVTAIEVADCLNIPYREGFVKNHFMGRTFMLANHEQRTSAVRSKLSPVAVEFKDKNVLLVDDSIVRGTTSKEIVNIVRKCGAKKVYLASAAPQVRFPNVYGIDMPTHDELVAYKKNDDEITKIIGADKVIFQTLDNLKKSVTDVNTKLTQFDASCFDGIYVTGDVNKNYLDSLLSVAWNG